MPALVLPLLALAVAVAFLGFMLASTSGHFVPQVVDLYLICQYARAWAEGHPFRYNPGEPPSTGATSLLHTLLLGAAHKVGFRGEGLVAFAILTGAVFYFSSVFLARRVGARLGGPREGDLAAVLVALGGPVVWAFFYGSDVALFTFLALWLLERLLRQEADGAAGSATGHLAVVVATLMALARPEGLLVAVVLGLFWTLGPPSLRHRSRFLPWVPLAAAVAVLALNRGLTGQWMGSSVGDKSLLANYGLAGTVAMVSEYLVDVVRGLLLGFYPSQAPVGLARGWAPFVFPPLGLLLVLLAVARTRRPALWLWLLAVVPAAAIGASNTFLGVHFNRYLLWIFPGLLVLVAVGWGQASAALAPGDPGQERRLFGAGAGLLVVLGLLSTLRFAVQYGDMAGEVYRRDVATAQWIDGHLPPGVAMANAVTSVEYLTGHRNLNLHGVTSPAFFGNHTAEREAGVLESLFRLPAAERPPYLISSTSFQQASAFMREIVDGPPLFRTTGVGDEIEIYRTRYDVLGPAESLYLPETLLAVSGRKEVDRLNVCDARDEAAHRYQFHSALGNLSLHGTARVADYEAGPRRGLRVADAGRAILGSEAFDVRAEGGRDLVVVMRTAPDAEAVVFTPTVQQALPLDFSDTRLRLEVDGQPAAQAAFRPGPGWYEAVLYVPGAVVKPGRTRLRLSGHYASFRYWFYQ